MAKKKRKTHAERVAPATPAAPAPATTSAATSEGKGRIGHLPLALAGLGALGGAGYVGMEQMRNNPQQAARMDEPAAGAPALSLPKSLDELEAFPRLRRELDFDASKTAFAAMYEYVITDAKDTKPYAGSLGAGPCVILALYNPDTKTAGMIHIAEYDEADKPLRTEDIANFDSVMNMAKKVGAGAKRPLEMSLLGGVKETREKTVGKVLEMAKKEGWVLKAAHLNTSFTAREFAHMRDMNDDRNHRSALVIDARTGDVGLVPTPPRNTEEALQQMRMRPNPEAWAQQQIENLKITQQVLLDGAGRTVEHQEKYRRDGKRMDYVEMYDRGRVPALPAPVPQHPMPPLPQEMGALQEHRRNDAALALLEKALIALPHMGNHPPGAGMRLT